METVRPETQPARVGGLPTRRTGVGRPGLDRAPSASRACAGFRALVPGLAQWGWGQRERGLVLSGSFAAAAAVSILTWGTATGLALLAFGFLTHVVSTTDALSQDAFSREGRRARRLVVSLGLGVGVYVPLLAAASLVAWPGLRGFSRSEGYLVDCSAYRLAEPRNDDWVWYQSGSGGGSSVGRVVAGRGEEVEWSGDLLRVNGRKVLGLKAPFSGSKSPRRMAYRVPEGHVLVEPDGATADGRHEGFVMVPREQIVGRAWARLYPIRERHLLLSGQRSGRLDQS